MRASVSSKYVGVGAPDVALVGRHLGHRRGRLGGQRPDRSGVQVDARGQGRERLPDRRQLLRIGQEGDDHGRMIPTMSGLARPEILATTEWLAESIGRLGVRVLDAPLAARRQRPGGPRQRPHPGRRARRLAGRPRRRRRERRGHPARRPRPDGGPGRAGRASPTTPRSSSMTTRRACSRPGRGGACGPTASSRSGSSTAATRTGSAEGREVSNARGRAGHGRASRSAARTGRG